MTIDDFKGISLFFDGSLAKKYIYGPGMDNPAAMINVSGVSETWYYYYADALGSIRLMSNAGGAIVEGYAYDVFGRPRVMTSAGADGNWLTEDAATYNYSSIGNPYLFTGRRWDSVAGLYYYRFRDYSPDLGRFLQTDPLGYIDGMNLYQYCGNNPVNWIDPWGLEGKECGIGNWFKAVWEAIKEAIAPPDPTPVVQTVGNIPTKAADNAEWNITARNTGGPFRPTPYTMKNISSKPVYVPPIDADGDGDLDWDRDGDFDVDMNDARLEGRDDKIDWLPWVKK